MKNWKETTQEDREKFEDLIKEHCSYLDFEVFSEEPYIQFPDGSVIYIEGIGN